MAQADAIPASPAHACGFAASHRKDNWWAGPMATALGLGAFGVYATFRAIYNGQYVVGIDTEVQATTHAHLLSPFYSPLLTGLIPTSMRGWFSPAFLILWAPGGFRLTCYYYRKAYYRAFFMDPVGCSVGEPDNFCGIKRGLAYKGETKLLLFQNLHRYFLYLALGFLVILSYDFVLACIWPTPSGGRTFGLSLGSLVLAANVTLLSLYTLGCHSLRHLVGGRVNSFSRAPLGKLRYQLWRAASALNRGHMLWAWLSLFMVGFADFYVWMVALGVFPDPAFLGG